ncbi:MAG: hypothetical protein ACE5OQ_07320 [Woeseia sp.]
MIGLDIQTGLYLLGAAVLGGVVGWLIKASLSSRNLDQVGLKWRGRFDEAIAQRDKLYSENHSLKASLEAEQAAVQKYKHAAIKSRTDIESVYEKTNTLSKELVALGAERDELKEKLSKSQIIANTAKQQLAQLQEEFAKVQDFYKGQLESALEQRKLLERKFEDAKSEQDSLRNLLMASKAEHESVSNLLASAQSRLENLDEIEQKIVSLEADNAQLKHEAAQATRESESLKRDAAELEALQVQNRELAHCLQSMESSRKQYEIDARRYRSQYEQSEQESETLRFKLGDIKKNLAGMRNVPDQAQGSATTTADSMPIFGLSEPEGEADDLTEIVGIGKVFEETLHDLGVYHYWQIAAFGPAEIARINSELKEFKGRIEHDDWIGQAKELHLKKYGESGI